MYFNNKFTACKSCSTIGGRDFLLCAQNLPMASSVSFRICKWLNSGDLPDREVQNLADSVKYIRYGNEEIIIINYPPQNMDDYFNVDEFSTREFARTSSRPIGN